MASLTRADVRELVDGIAQQAPIEANRTAALISVMLNFALDRDVIAANPATRLKEAEEHSRERVLTDDEIRAFWQTCDKLPPAMVGFFKLRLVTAQRGKEVAAMRWSDVDGDIWTIPAAVAKNGLSHRVPLSPLAQRILTDLRAAQDAFRQQHPYAQVKTHVIAGARVAKQQQQACQSFGLPDFVPHDLRRTAASRMAASVRRAS